jgi:hypothetical protein
MYPPPLDNPAPVLRAARFGSVGGLRLPRDTAVDEEAVAVHVVGRAGLRGEQLPVGPGEAGAVHVLGVGGELGVRVVGVGVDAPFLDVDEFVVGGADVAGEGSGPLALVAALGTGISVHWRMKK